MESSKLSQSRDVHVIFIGLKGGKHFNLNAVLYFKLASSYGCTQCYIGFTNIWIRIICEEEYLENSIQFVGEAALNWESGNPKSNYSSALNLLYDHKCLVSFPIQVKLGDFETDQSNVLNIVFYLLEYFQLFSDRCIKNIGQHLYANGKNGQHT